MSVVSTDRAARPCLAAPPPGLEAEALSICAELIRIDTSNPGKPERPAAEYVAELLADVGIDGELFEAEPGRSNYVARLEGDGSSAEALVVHGHLDVVPANPSAWRHHPFSAELDDGCLWGRGAVDMKDMVAMTLAVVRHLASKRTQPKRDLILAFFADEECGARLGSGFMVHRHPALFDGATAAIGELGGFSVTLAGARLYPVQVAEKGGRAIRARARGVEGHGSMPRADNPVVVLSEAIARAGSTSLPFHMTPTTRTILSEASDALGVVLDPMDDPRSLAALGKLRPWFEAALHNTITPTILRAGDKGNVIPADAEAVLDCRFVPGGEQALTEALTDLLGPNVEWEAFIDGPAVEAPWDHPLPGAMAVALRDEDPAARPVPFMVPAATDAKNLSKLGMACYGFAPLMLPEDLDFAALFHGVDERVPIEALAFGTRVLKRLLSTY